MLSVELKLDVNYGIPPVAIVEYVAGNATQVILQLSITGMILSNGT